MKAKEKMLAVMTKCLKSDFPLVIELGLWMRDPTNWKEITDQHWWSAYQGADISASLKVIEDTYRKLDQDWVRCGTCPSKEWRETHRIETKGMRAFLVNTLTGEKTEIDREPLTGHKVTRIDREPLVESLMDINKQVHVIDAESLIRNGRLDYVEMLVEKFGSEKFILSSIGQPFWSALQSIFGLKGMMINLYKKPKLVEHTLERVTAVCIEVLRAYAKTGVDGVWIEECLTSSDDISLSHFKRFALPYTVELISEIRRLGMKSIHYFCGGVRDRIELIVDAGPDAISLEESKKGFEIDLDWVDKVVDGRVCLFGNLDAMNLLQNGTTEELRREIRRQINIGRRHGKFVMCTGCPPMPETALSRLREYIEIARQESRSSATFGGS